ncbi:hypothetical protein FAF44_51935 [Nonomuraea sp. MG754425]|uniref:hypothetical protein n=1 Tax=Nonomuraea sp. MG754425 TaxID=2570319 RepID=UPI001F31C1CC|nr:hypothetical protein [Nonomuraea sp. MG754425]MCF6476777.1 hypothetical protein [Nonomuraea sp. MG754425]
MRKLARVPLGARRTAKASAFIAAITVCCLVAAQGTSYATPQDPAPADNSGQDVTDALSTVGIKVLPDGWIEYKSMLRSVGASGEMSRVAGTREEDGGCTLPGSDETPPDSSRTTFTEEVAYNPATCEFDILVADLTTSQAADLNAMSDADPSDVSSTGDAATSDETGVVAPAATTYSRYLKTSWIDPINITISSQKVGLKWTSSSWRNWAYKRDSFKGCIGGVCLDKTYIYSSSDSFSTLSNGWKKTANVHFRNTSFALWVVAILGPTGWAACGFPTSSRADFYHKDSVTGYKNGGSAWSWSDSKSGACTNLVHHGKQTGASYPF